MCSYKNSSSFDPLGHWKIEYVHVSSHLSHQHFIDEDPQSPPVYGSGVGCICEDLWGQKLRRPTECACPVPIAHSCRQIQLFKAESSEEKLAVAADDFLWGFFVNLLLKKIWYQFIVFQV